MNGYESDIDLQNLRFTGDIPAANNIGNFGVATSGPEGYVLTLIPPLTTYRVGLELRVLFDGPLTQPQIEVDNQIPIPLRKYENGALQDLLPEDINEVRVYSLRFDGSAFQVDVPLAFEP
ncbi:MAG: hypothetical protein JXQ90_18380 [Cyclobacteriaceae bacterium]